MPIIHTNFAANTALHYLNSNSASESLSLAKIVSESRIIKTPDNLQAPTVNDLNNRIGSAYSVTISDSAKQAFANTTSTTSATSQIKDVDIASESAALSNLPILQQTSITALSQANQAPQQLLSLFR